MGFKITWKVEGVQELQRMLRMLHGKDLKSVLNSALQWSLVPMRERAKELAPVSSGNLRRSIGVERTTGTFGALNSYALGVRRKFTMKRGGKRLGFDNQRTSFAYDRDTGFAEAEQKHPMLYAHFIEFGVTKSGARKRKAGPAHFMTQAFNEEKPRLADRLRIGAWRGLDKLARKKAKAAAAA